MSESREFRCATWLKGLTALGFVAFSACTLVLFWKQGFSLLSVSALGLSVFALVGVLDAFTMRVTVAEDSIEVVRNLRRKTWPRAAFTSAASAKGCPIILVLADGGKVVIPDGLTGLHVNTLRAWLKRPGTAGTTSTDRWIVGPEHNVVLFDRLGSVLRSLGYQLGDTWSGVAGSQNITRWKVTGPGGSLEVEAETYVGISVSGPAKLVAEVRQGFSQ